MNATMTVKAAPTIARQLSQLIESEIGQGNHPERWVERLEAGFELVERDGELFVQINGALCDTFALAKRLPHNGLFAAPGRLGGPVAGRKPRRRSAAA